MLDVKLEQLLEAGVHFGHQKSRWNPKMKPYIFGVRGKIHIIDLRKTIKHLKNAYEVMRTYSAQGRSILFVGTKKQIKDIIAEEAQRA
ncbi:30S ribosomal protein S2, partial [bacterium]|nr:30S ribosomal protein S2 [bacterium]